MLRRYTEVERGLRALADLGVVAAAWMGAVWLRFGSGWLPEPPLHNPNYGSSAALLGVILPIWYVLLRQRGLYHARVARSAWREARRVVEVTVIGTALLGTATFFLKIEWMSRLVVLLFMGLSAASLIGVRMGVRHFHQRLRQRQRERRTILIVGAGRLGREVCRRLQADPELRFGIAGFLGPADASAEPDLPPVIGRYEALHDLATSGGIEHVVIALDRSDPTDPLKLVEELRDTTAAVRIVPDLLNLGTLQSGVENLGDLPMLRIIESPLIGWSRVAKRALDLSVSVLGLGFGSPLFALIAIGVRASSPGPVFYRQQRMGLDGELFEMIKFRTMRPDAEARTGAVWATRDDPRVTPIGRVLRKTNLDELPQLWNVLKGEMSLVGPRPERPEFIREFRTRLPGYMLRHKAKGGMTGWAQVNGCRGDTSIEERLEYDIEYLRRWSFNFDLKILVLTFVRGFNDPNAY